MTTFFNKRILGNRKKHGFQAGGAAALIAAVAAYRGLEEEGLPMCMGKLSIFSLGFGVVAGLVWASTPAAKKIFTANDRSMINRAVRPTIIIGVASTIRDFEDDRMTVGDSKGSTGSRNYSYPWSNRSTSYRRSGSSNGPSWNRRSYASALDADDDDDGSILDDNTLRSIAEGDSGSPVLDDDLSILLGEDS